MIYVLNFLMVIVIIGMISVSSVIDLTWLDSNGIVWREKERSLADFSCVDGYSDFAQYREGNAELIKSVNGVRGLLRWFV